MRQRLQTVNKVGLRLMSKPSPQWRDGALASVSDLPIRFYEVDKNIFFREFHVQLEGSERYQKAMFELMDRYSIQKKNILCLGPGKCEQEYWLSSRGNKLLLVDIDEKGDIEPRLQKITAEKTQEESIVYAIGDARKMGEYLRPFDVIASFGFTPDEFHRSKTQEELLINKSGIGWPVGANPFSSIVLDICDVLPEKGLFVSLSYCGGPDALSLPYIPALQAALRDRGMSLLEVYQVSGTPGVHLVRAAKTLNPHQFDIASRPLISTIHPKSKTTSDATLIFSLFEKGTENLVFGSRGGVLDEVCAAVGYALAECSKSTHLHCYFEGDSSEEAHTLLSHGFSVSTFSDKPFDGEYFLFENYGCLRFVSKDELPTIDYFNIVWLSNVTRDDELRANFTSLSSASSTNRMVFSDVTHIVLDRLQRDGIVVVVGRGGCEVDAVPNFKLQLAKEFAEHQITLENLYALKIATGIFLAIGRKAVSPHTNKPITKFYPSAEDASVIEVTTSAKPINSHAQKAAWKGLLGYLYRIFRRVP